MIDYNKILLGPLLLLLITTDVFATERGQLETLGPEGCTYYEVDVQYENGEMPSGSHEMDACELTNGKMVDIIGLDNEFKYANKGKLVSGRTKLSIVGASMKSGKLYVPNTFQVQMAQVQIEKKPISNKDKISIMGFGTSQVTKKVLVIRATAPDASTTSTMSQISDKIFGTDGDSYNLKSHYAACSYNELLFEPFSGNMNGETIVAGVGDVTLTSNIVGVDKNVVKQNMLDAADEKYGDLSTKITNSELDYVMLCLPPGTGSWVAYAYVNGWLSVYNDYWCNSLSAQMHEVGHNLGLAHSGETSAYDDKSGMMGYSYNQDEGPVMCFNAAKNFQLGWYNNGEETITPLQSNAEKTFFDGRLIGIAEYDLIDTASIDKAIVQITGYGNDYYVSFNSRKGINSGTQEGGNQVLVHSRSPGQGYSTSTLVAKLSSGQEYTIEGISDTIVRVDGISTSSTPSYANVYVGNARCSADSDCDRGEFCTEYSCNISSGICNSIQDCSQCGGKVDVEIMSDNYGTETTWEVINTNDSGKAMQGGPYSANNLATASSCLGFGNYEFKIYDSYSDGICCSYGSGYYKLSLDDEVLKEGGSFGSSDEYLFEITQNNIPPTLAPISPTNAPTTLNPTINPTKVPTLPPTFNSTNAPTSPPTTNPTNTPTSSPTLPPTESPTKAPTLQPTFNPTDTPTSPPTTNPTNTPSSSPTLPPTESPTNTPTFEPTVLGTAAPSKNPIQTSGPTPTPVLPTSFPTQSPVQVDICPSGYSGLIATNDCKGFYHCQYGSLLDDNPTMCPPGLLFNQNAQVCDWSYNVVCESADVTAAPTKSSIFPSMSPEESPTNGPTQGGICAMENKSATTCGANKNGKNPEICCSGLICNKNGKKCVKEENYGCAGNRQKARECGRTGNDIADVCCPGFVCDFDRRMCIK